MRFWQRPDWRAMTATTTRRSSPSAAKTTNDLPQAHHPQQRSPAPLRALRGLRGGHRPAAPLARRAGGERGAAAAAGPGAGPLLGQRGGAGRAGGDDLGPAGPAAPWLAVAVHESAAAHPEALVWLGDLGRCMAWAWITLEPDLGAAS